MRRFFARGLVLLLASLWVPLALASPASAGGDDGTTPAVEIKINCSSVTYSYTGFPVGSTANPTRATQVYGFNGGDFQVKDITFTTSSFTDVVPITASNGDLVSASITTNLPDGSAGPEILYYAQNVNDCAPPCPQGTKLNFRWHYRANGSSGSWSGTKTVYCPGSLNMGPQAMGGDLKVAPGTVLESGYDFTSPGNNSTFFVTVTDAQTVFTVRCVSGATPSQSTFTVTMPNATYTVKDSAWYPSGDQKSPAVYQGSVTVPDACYGGHVRLNKGGTFSAEVA